ncbi:tellurium resistance protein [Lysinibacillus contaminans]|uniref:Tellurium resistance protein n=1 Tax=Lysinibacillus contaminans TaxID=1293441 RepID=A0ABR5K2X2_9BACI|nr:TerD domain-containing protein [Lysinibacillus contaminans]KOS69099.1 tellurium resistance protein [Lysinibacillus contaminans]
MALTLVKGQKVDVTKTNLNLVKLNVELGWQVDEKIELDASVFLLAENGKVRSDADFIFYGQPSSECGSVKKNASGNKHQQFQIEWSEIPTDIQKIVFSLTIFTANQSFKQASSIYLKMSDPQTGSEILQFKVPNTFSNETAIVVGELYRHAGQWKFNSIGAGYFGGLEALCGSFGVVVDDEPTVAATIMEEKPKSKPIEAVNLGKIELKKKQSVNIQKSQRITATLEWETNKDLDLYCFYVMKNGRTGKVYYRDLGAPNQYPFIKLDGDAQQFGKETIEIYKTDELAFVLFAAYSAVGNGVGSFYSMKAKAIVDNHKGSVVVAPLLERNKNSYWVAIAQMNFTDDKEMQVSHVERYSKNHSEASPRLYEDGTFKMDAGPIEFK